MKHWLVLLIVTQMAGSWARALGGPSADLRAEGQNSSPRPVVDRDRWMAVVGDSGVTGAASDPDLSANVFTLLGRFGVDGVSSVLDTVVSAPADVNRVFYSTRELREAEERGGGLELRAQAVAAATVDRFENAFGAKVARAMGLGLESVVVVGQDGKRVSSIPTQLERIYEVGAETLPPVVLMSFTANDFCDLGVFTDTLAARVSAFERSLAEAWDKSKLFMKAHPRGTEFVVLAPLDVSNVLTNPGILDQEIPLGLFGRVTCRDLRERTVGDDPVASAIAEGFVGMCPAVLGTRPTDVARLARLRDVQDGFNAVWKRQIAKLNRIYRGRGLSWRYVEGTRHLAIGRGDVAKECFHPSDQGHDKIAAEVVRALGAPVTAASTR